MDDMSTDPLSDDAMPFGGHLPTWQEARRRSDARLAAAEAGAQSANPVTDEKNRRAGAGRTPGNLTGVCHRTSGSVSATSATTLELGPSNRIFEGECLPRKDIHSKSSRPLSRISPLE